MTARKPKAARKPMRGSAVSPTFNPPYAGSLGLGGYSTRRDRGTARAEDLLARTTRRGDGSMLRPPPMPKVSE